MTGLVVAEQQKARDGYQTNVGSYQDRACKTHEHYGNGYCMRFVDRSLEDMALTHATRGLGRVDGGGTRANAIGNETKKVKNKRIGR